MIPSRLPARSGALSYHDALVRGRPYADRFGVYETIHALYENETTRAQALRMLQETTLIQVTPS